MNVDWEDVLQEADDSPRSILAEVTSRVDEITNLAILFHDKDGKQHEYYCVASNSMAIAMLSLAHYTAVQEIAES